MIDIIVVLLHPLTRQLPLRYTTVASKLFLNHEIYTVTCFCLPYKTLAIVTWNNDFTSSICCL